MNKAIRPITLPEASAVKQPKEVILIIDVSGSMYSPLHTIRQNLTSQLMNALSPEDQLSVVWFSGKREYGAAFKHVTVENLKDITTLGKNLEKWLQPIGLTGFEGPLQLAQQIAQEAGRPTFVQFMSDGMDNQSSKNAILNEAEALGKIIGGAEVIEYGEYADRVMLENIASKLGGKRLKVNEAGEYTDKTLKLLQEENTTLKVKVDITGALYAAGFDEEGEALIFTPDQAGVTYLPTNVKNVSAFYGLPDQPESATQAPQGKWQDMLYVHLMLSAARMDARGVDQTLRLLGDRELSLLSGKLFGKQRYELFEKLVREKIKDPSKRYAQGVDFSALPNPNAVTIVDILNTLDDGRCKLLIQDDAFRPNRISRKTHQRTLEEEQKFIREQHSEKPEKLDSALKALTTRAVAGATFIPDENNTQGVTITALVTHEERANLSLQVKIPGKVTFKSTEHGIPNELTSNTYRTYNVVFGGVINLHHLPIIPSAEALKTFKELGVVPEETKHGEKIILNLLDYPMTNRANVQQVSAVELARIATKMLIQKAIIKVLNDTHNSLFAARTSAGLTDTYGEQATQWLRTVGVTDHGFSPPSTSEEGTDVIVVPELLVKLAGLSSLPPVKNVSAKMKEKKPLTLSEELIGRGLQKLQDFRQVHQGKQEAQLTMALKNFLDIETHAAKTELSKLRRRFEEIRMAVLLGGAWFHDLPEDGKISFTEQTHRINASITTREYEEKL